MFGLQSAELSAWTHTNMSVVNNMEAVGTVGFLFPAMGLLH